MRQYSKIRGTGSTVGLDMEGALTAFSRLFVKMPLLIATILKASIVFAVISTGVSSCGFTPVYGEGSSTREVLVSVILDDPRDRREQVFLKAVEQRLPPPVIPKYQVKYHINLHYEGLDVIGAARIQVVGQVTATLVDLNTSAVQSTFAVDGFVGYTETSVLQGTQRRDAESRLLQILADKFITRLMVETSKLGANDA